MNPADTDMKPGNTCVKPSEGKTLLIACGALAHEITDLIELYGWNHLAVTCLPAKLHHDPSKIPEAVRKKIHSKRAHYEKMYVVYGDCGTGGMLDKVLVAEGVERIPGPHCFSFFQGNETFAKHSSDDIATFYLTDFFCQYFEKFVWEALGLDRRDDMAEFVFSNYTKLVFMPQTKNQILEKKAQKLAERLNLEYEYRFHGYGDLEIVLQRL